MQRRQISGAVPFLYFFSAFYTASLHCEQENGVVVLAEAFDRIVCVMLFFLPPLENSFSLQLTRCDVALSCRDEGVYTVGAALPPSKEEKTKRERKACSFAIYAKISGSSSASSIK